VAKLDIADCESPQGLFTSEHSINSEAAINVTGITFCAVFVPVPGVQCGAQSTLGYQGRVVSSCTVVLRSSNKERLLRWR